MEKQSLNQIEDNSEWYNALIQEMNEKYNDDPELDSQFWERAQKKAQAPSTTTSESKT
jgi:hypothetical protein|tara:strand:+ start:1064 stop:1237 length:174 start_codon:yes stop_codon:yes gene_type:complete